MIRSPSSPPQAASSAAHSHLVEEAYHYSCHLQRLGVYGPSIQIQDTTQNLKKRTIGRQIDSDNNNKRWHSFTIFTKKL